MIYVLEWVSSMRESVVNIRWMYDICPWMGVEYEGECGKYQVNVWYMSLNGCRVTPIQGHISYIHLIFTTLSFILDTHSRTYIIYSPDIYHTLPHTRHLFKNIYHTFTWYLPHSPSYSTPIQGYDICPWIGVEYEGESGKYQVNIWYMFLNRCRVWGRVW
jgi:hypothetical protein